MSETILNGVFVALIALALVLWARALTRGEVHRWLDSPSRLGGWKIDSSSFLLFLLLICCSPLLSVWTADLIFRQLGVEPAPADAMLVHGFGQYLFWLLACLIFRLPADQSNDRTNVYVLVAVGRGLRAFLLFLPILTLATFGWMRMLSALGLPIEEQDAVQILRTVDSPLHNFLWALQIIVVASLVEELVFRAGLFRYLMDRLPMKWAVIATSLVFGLIHMSWVAVVPLTLLGVVLCLVYAKTGRLAAPIVLHAMVNLNSFLIIRFTDSL